MNENRIFDHRQSQWPTERKTPVKIDVIASKTIFVTPKSHAIDAYFSQFTCEPKKEHRKNKFSEQMWVVPFVLLTTTGYAYTNTQTKETYK